MLPSSDTRPGPPRGGGSARARCPAPGGQRWGRAARQEPAVSPCPQNRPHPAAMLMCGGTCFPPVAPVPPKSPCGLRELAADPQPLRSQPIRPPFFHGTVVFPVSPLCQAPQPPTQPRTDVHGPRQLCSTGTDVQGTAQLRKALCPRSCASRCRRATPCTCATPDTHACNASHVQHLAHTQRPAGTSATPRATPV